MYIFASVKAITIKFLVWENTTRKELQLLELTSKVTTEFAHNCTSRKIVLIGGCRFFVSDVISEVVFGPFWLMLPGLVPYR